MGTVNADAAKVLLPLDASSREGTARQAWTVIGALAVGYVGIYLCRKNLGVAVPLLQASFHTNKAQVGKIASMGTFAYAMGKLLSGPVVDRLGGRHGFLLSMVLVSIFGVAGALAPGLFGLMIFYGLNRFAGAAGWGAAIKLVPTWFGVVRTATVIAVLSLSYVVGGVLATLLARQIVTFGGGWRAVMGIPSAVLLIAVLACAFLVRAGPRHPQHKASSDGVNRTALFALLRKPQFLIACGLSFAVTLLRESFNTWAVDFLTSVQTGTQSVAAAALHSIGFDLAGAGAIVVAGLAYDRIRAARRRWLMAGTLLVLAVVLAILPGAAKGNLLVATWLLGFVGLLVYGPYSLLSGVLAIESGGAALAATAANVIDGVGYLAAILAGVTFGKLLDVGGYALGFGALAAITGAAALLALGLRSTHAAALVSRPATGTP
jgi:MFS transporter, OPA family, glycerol-3-phosphate transporter